MRTHTAAYGADANDRLRWLVGQAKRSDPLAPVTVIVPTNAAGVAARRLLASGLQGQTAGGSGIAGIAFVTVRGLGERLGAARLAAQGRRPASTPVLGAVIRQVLHDDPGVFAPVYDHPGTQGALIRVHRELVDCSAATLEELGRLGGRAADVVRVHRAARHRLVGRWYEDADLLAAAGDVARSDSPLLAELGAVIVHLPQDLSVPACAFLADIAARRPTDVILGRTGVPAADAVPVRSVRRMGGSDEGVAAPLVRGTRVVSVSDADEEARTAVAEVVQAARRGVPLERVAVLYPRREPYARILCEHFAAAGIPYHGPAVRPLSESVMGRWLRELLDLPASDFDRGAVLRLLTSAPMRDRDGRGLPTRRWERISRDAGVVRGLQQWGARLGAHARELRCRAARREALEDGDGVWRGQRDRRDADEAEKLAGLIADLGAGVAGPTGERGWAQWSSWTLRTIAAHLGGDEDRSSWPPSERSAAQRVESIVEQLAVLDEVGGPADLKVFRRTLTLALQEAVSLTGSLGEGVLMGTPESALGVEFDTIVMLGLAEGTCPARPHEDPLLHDDERALVADDLAPRRTRVAEQHRYLLAAMASATGERVMVWPRGDLRRSVERTPSRWLLDTLEALTGQRSMPQGAHEAVEVVPSFGSRAAHRRFPATEQDYALQWLDDHLRHHDLAAHQLAAAGRPLGRALRMQRARRSDEFTRFDGNVARIAEQLPAPTDPGARVSASALERYLTCPHAYLMQHVLGIRAVDNPEELLEITPADRGSLVHEILEAWLEEQLRDPPLPQERWTAQARQRLREISEEKFAEYERRGLTGDPRIWAQVRGRLEAELARFVDEDDKRRAHYGAQPFRVELPFGFDGTDPVPIEVSGHGTLQLRGKVDRVDLLPGRGLLVTDYKTGRVDERVSAETPLVDGTKLQLPLYAVAVRVALNAPDVETVSEYWYTSTRGQFRAAGYPVTDAVLEQLDAALGVTLEGISAGRFPARPQAPGFRLYVDCEYCDPDGLGTAARYRRWQRLRSHPELRGYLELVEPKTAAELDEESSAGADAHAETEGTA